MSEARRERVVAARAVQATRYEGEHIFSNARQKSRDRQLTADDARTRLKRF
jgi:hypothetical protein